jgi:hypothetical protein
MKKKGGKNIFIISYPHLIKGGKGGFVCSFVFSIDDPDKPGLNFVQHFGVPMTGLTWGFPTWYSILISGNIFWYHFIKI